MSGLVSLRWLTGEWSLRIVCNTLYSCRDDGKAAVELELEDNGLGADQVAGDGLYAKYFIGFAPSPVGMLSNR